MAVFDVAVATGDIIKYQSFMYGSLVWEIQARYNNTIYIYIPYMSYQNMSHIELCYNNSFLYQNLTFEGSINNFLRDKCQEDAEKNCDHWCEGSDRGSQWGSLYRQKNLIMPGQSIKKHATETLILLAVYMHRFR